MDELRGILIAYEMRKEHDTPTKYEAEFKLSRREKEHQASDSLEK